MAALVVNVLSLFIKSNVQGSHSRNPIGLVHDSVGGMSAVFGKPLLKHSEELTILIMQSRNSASIHEYSKIVT